MFLESLGKIFFLKMRPVFFFILVSSPLLITGIFILQKRFEIASFENLYESTLIKAYKSLDFRSRKEQFLTRYSSPEPYFLNQTIETLPLLQNEIKFLKEHRKHPAVTDKDQIENRLAYLTGKNKISFVEESIRSNSLYKETDEIMKRAVEMNEEDVKKVLALIENVQIGPYEPSSKSPQLIISNLTLKRKKNASIQHTFDIKLDLLKREFNKQ
ncbi:MAG: hypothetical protein JSS32_01235 [Verrucomicrobia bacterium]|nr:hypothetical protein [Verrucomicrobiota bacterium]